MTLAAFLHRFGHDVELFDAGSAFSEVGAGLLISPNGSRVLAELGLADGLAAIGTRSERVQLKRWEDDRVLLSLPLGDAPVRQFGHPHYNVYRPDLIELLATALDGVSLRMNAEVTGARSTSDGAIVSLAGGSTVPADVVVGADGVRSAVRTSVFGPHPSRFSNLVAYRALVPREVVPDLPLDVTNRLGPGRHVVSYFVGRDQSLLNLMCTTPDDSWDIESWTEPGTAAALRAEFASWSPELRHVLDHVIEPIYRWALHDRTPLRRWTDGNVTLLGDACHPMLPFMAQGACQAIEDAIVLARCLTEIDDAPAVALKRYEEMRKARTSRMQLGSWDNATTYNLPDGVNQQSRDDYYAVVTAASDGTTTPFAEIYGYDAVSAAI